MAELTAAAAKINEEGAADGVVGAVMRGIRSDTIMDTLAGVVLNSFGEQDAPLPYNLWFDGGWDNPRLDDPAICQGLTDYALMLAAGPANKFAIDWPDANTLFQQGRAAFFIDASLFGPGYEDPDAVHRRRQDRLLRPSTPGSRRQLHDRPLAVGPGYPQRTRPTRTRRGPSSST